MRKPKREPLSKYVFSLLRIVIKIVNDCMNEFKLNLLICTDDPFIIHVSNVVLFERKEISKSFYFSIMQNSSLFKVLKLNEF